MTQMSNYPDFFYIALRRMFMYLELQLQAEMVAIDHLLPDLSLAKTQLRNSVTHTHSPNTHSVLALLFHDNAKSSIKLLQIIKTRNK